MRDVLKIFAAGLLLTVYAVAAPTLVEALPGAPDAGKAYTQRLAQADAVASAHIDFDRVDAATAGRPMMVRMAMSGGAR